jgi:hypothetical protein
MLLGTHYLTNLHYFSSILQEIGMLVDNCVENCHFKQGLQESWKHTIEKEVLYSN